MVLGLKGTAVIDVKHLKQVLFLHDSLCRTGLLEPEPWLWAFHKGWEDNVETWAVSKAIYSMWEELSRLLAGVEVQPSTAGSSAWGVLVVIGHHSQACLWNYSSAKLHWTWKYQKTEEYLVKEICLSTTLQLVASWFRYNFFLNQISVQKASISLIPFLLNRKNLLLLQIHMWKSIVR